MLDVSCFALAWLLLSWVALGLAFQKTHVKK